MIHLHHLAIWLLLAVAAMPLSAQQFPEEEEETRQNLPEWLIRLSNMKAEQKQAYVRTFTLAKQAYLAEEWVTCIRLLNDCDMLLPGNPNVWNLRVSCLTEQQYYDEAEQELQKVRQVLPENPVTLVNIANLHLARGHYQECIDEINELLTRIPAYGTEPLRHILQYRILLSHLMLGNESAAREITKDLSPLLSDTPLYYYGEAAFHIFHGRRSQAMQDIQAADNIFAKGNVTQPYRRALAASGLIAKHLSEPQP